MKKLFIILCIVLLSFISCHTEINNGEADNNSEVETIEAAPNPPENPENPPEITVKTKFSVILVRINEAKKIATIKLVQEIVPGIDLKHAKDLVEIVPSVIITDVSSEQADQIISRFAALGATARKE